MNIESDLRTKRQEGDVGILTPVNVTARPAKFFLRWPEGSDAPEYDFHTQRTVSVYMLAPKQSFRPIGNEGPNNGRQFYMQRTIDGYGDTAFIGQREAQYTESRVTYTGGVMHVELMHTPDGTPIPATVKMGEGGQVAIKLPEQAGLLMQLMSDVSFGSVAEYKGKPVSPFAASVMIALDDEKYGLDKTRLATAYQDYIGRVYNEVFAGQQDAVIAAYDHYCFVTGAKPAPAATPSDKYRQAESALLRLRTEEPAKFYDILVKPVSLSEDIALSLAARSGDAFISDGVWKFRNRELGGAGTDIRLGRNNSEAIIAISKSPVIEQHLMEKTLLSAFRARISQDNCAQAFKNARKHIGEALKSGAGEPTKVRLSSVNVRPDELRQFSDKIGAGNVSHSDLTAAVMQMAEAIAESTKATNKLLAQQNTGGGKTKTKGPAEGEQTDLTT